MPIYEYRCTKGHTFEVVQRMTDDALSECEVCGASAQRVFSAPAVHFKGSGFYNTDYGKKTKGASSSGEGGDSASGSESGKSDSKAESSSKGDGKGGEKKSTPSTASSKSASAD